MATAIASERTMEQASIRERDMALALHETFLGSGSEDALSPRFQNLDIRSPPSSSPRTPRTSHGPESSQKSSGKPSTQQLGQKSDEQAEDESNFGNEAYLKSLRETEFENHERGVARLNNGSFGACPKSVLLQQEQWVEKWLLQPDTFYFGPLERGLLESRRIVAAHVGCPTEELVLLDNVTVAASVVAMDLMWSFVQGQYQNGDSILLSNFTYGAVRTAFEAYGVRAGARILVADIPFPISSAQEIVRCYEIALEGARKEGNRIRLAVLDHVVSMPSIIVPLKEVVALCKSYGVEQIFVDAAQALGNVPVNLKEIDVDYYAGNLHKWFFAPSTVAFLHCKEKHMSRLHHPIISHNYGKGFASECEWMGTRDFSAMLAVPAAFEFLSKLPGGSEGMRAHNHRSVIAAGEMLAKAWGTYCGVSPELCASMAMVGLPPGLQIQTFEETLALRTRLRQEFSIEVHTFTPPRKQVDSLPVKGVTAHIRISHQIYNTWDEYIRLKDTISTLVVEKSKR